MHKEVSDSTELNRVDKDRRIVRYGQWMKSSKFVFEKSNGGESPRRRPNNNTRAYCMVELEDCGELFSAA